MPQFYEANHSQRHLTELVLSHVYSRLGNAGGETCNHAACYEHSSFIVTSIYTRDINFVSTLLARIQDDTIVANIEDDSALYRPLCMW